MTGDYPGPAARARATLRNVRHGAERCGEVSP